MITVVSLSRITGFHQIDKYNFYLLGLRKL